MNLVFLCKRRPMGRDLLDDPYGRFYYLPKLLADRGHQVRIVLLDYRGNAPVAEERDGIRWTSAPAARYLRTLNRELRTSKPDWLIGFSDTYFGILAAHYGRKFGARVCIDAYDNYESYISWLKPLHWLWRRALARADLVTAAGPGLVELMTDGRQDQASAVIPMAADPTGFEPLDKATSRERLGLPQDVKLVGYCGSLHKSRGAEVFFDAIGAIHAEYPQVRFVHSGRTWKNVPLPESLTSLGYVVDELMAPLLNSMDTLVVVNRASAFGHYSYPVKLYEAMSCQVPVVATRTRATEWILKDHPDRLVTPGDVDEMSATIIRSINEPAPSYRDVPTWGHCCDALESALARA